MVHKITNIQIIDSKPKDISVIDSKPKDISVIDSKPKNTIVYLETTTYSDSILVSGLSLGPGLFFPYVTYNGIRF